MRIKHPFVSAVLAFSDRSLIKDLQCFKHNGSYAFIEISICAQYLSYVSAFTIYVKRANVQRLISCNRTLILIILSIIAVKDAFVCLYGA